MSLSEASEALRGLARACGVADGYWSARGERVRPPADTFRQVLVGLGVLESVAASEEEIQRALESRHTREWRSALPPVRVLRSGQPAGIELVVPSDKLHQLQTWVISTEDGASLGGEFVPVELNMAGREGGGVGDSRRELDGRAFELRWIALPALALGYHRLELGDGSIAQLVIAPQRCHLPNGDLASSRVWGPALQLYALRSERNWGIGDFTDLTAAVTAAAALGADVVGVNPLHALFAHEPEQASPYSPSSRMFLNPLYIDVEALPEWSSARACMPPSLDDELARLRDATFIDYSAVAGFKHAAFDAAYGVYCKSDTSAARERRKSFDDWRIAAGVALERFALFETLRERNAMDLATPTGAWQQWPDGWRTPESMEVSRLAGASAERVTFHAWLQWLAESQLIAVATRAVAAGLTVGLYRDLAVGIAGGGSDAWSDPTLYVTDIHVGAPPDDFSANGQDWGLPPFDPQRLREAGYKPFAEMLRDNMRAAGAIRIDHVMGLMRLFWIPAGDTPANGTYVDYPIDDLLAVLALESVRARCIVIGEDLGTVPDGLREKLRDAAVLSYRLMYFEKHYDGDQSFRRSDEYPAMALVGADTHDLPTLRGFWNATDLELRRSLNLFPAPGMLERQLEERAADKLRLLEALAREALLPPDFPVGDELDGAALAHIEMDDALVCAIHAWLARSDSLLLLANIEDLAGEVEQMNLPGTDRDVYPNWRRRLALDLADWAEDPRLRAAADAMNAGRS